MEWSGEAIERLKALWAEGHSTAEIGRRMGISKNAVVGKAHRLNLPARPSPIRREGSGGTGQDAPRSAAPRPPRPARPAATVSQPPAAAAMPPATAGTASAAATTSRVAPGAPAPRVAASMAPVGTVVRPFPRLGVRSCCWPMGEPGTPEFRFCSAEAIPGKPYCAEHAAVAYVKARDRREDAA